MANFLHGLRGMFGLDLLSNGNAPGHEDDHDVVGDDDGFDECPLTSLRQSAMSSSSEGDRKDSEDDSSSNNSDSSMKSDKEDAPSRPVRYLSFKTSENQDVTRSEEYLSSILNWNAVPHVGRHPLSTSVQFGPFTLAALEASVKQAADSAGFALYAHKGARKTAMSCSLKFGCECARKRYGKEKAAIEQKDRDFHKDIDEIVRDTCGKRKKQRKQGGCLRAHTQRSRVKSKDCTWTLCIKAVVPTGDQWSKDSSTLWTLNADPRCVNIFEHSNHCKSPHKRRISNAVKQFICEHGESMITHQLIDHIYRKYEVEISSDQVKYIMKCHSIKNKERGRGSCKAGGASDAIKFLLGTKASQVILFLNECLTGSWHTGEAGINSENGVEVVLSEYCDIRPKVFTNVDASRIISLSGKSYFVWSASWNYDCEKDLFSAYPEVVQLDCMHGVTTSTDGFNAVGIDGNGHNIHVLRAFISNQNSDVFRWIFRVAFPLLVPRCKDIRVFYTDGCQAMNTELQAACLNFQEFPNAKIFRCMFHLITKAFDDKFHAGDGWQVEVKKMLYRLRRCESDDEFIKCSEFVMRKIAAMQTLGNSQSLLRRHVLNFVKRRIDCSQIWVLKDQLKLPTRGCMATARVEGTHGHDRTTDRINARNSWFTTTKRHFLTSTRRQRAKEAWSRRQIGSQLLRNPMNAQDSAFQRKDLESLDASFLPWCLETLEEQGLLATRMRVVLKLNGYTKETKSFQPHSITKPRAAEFAVWVKDDDASDDGDSLVDAQHELENFDLRDSDNSYASETCSSSNDENSQSSTPPSKKNRSERFDGSEDTDESDNSFDADLYMNECLVQPLPDHVIFRYVKVRTVSLTPRYNDDKSFSDKYVFHCSCGFPNRIGVCCRHILAVLYHMILNLDDDGNTGDDDGDPTTIDWSRFPGILFELFNGSLCCKVKYHAVLHQKGHLFKTESCAFRPTIKKELPQQYLAEFTPDKNAIQNIPTNGLPLDDDDVPLGFDHEDNVEEHATKTTPHCDRDARERVPTLFRCTSILENAWKFSARFNPSDKSTARKIMVQRCLEMENEMRAMTTQHVAERDLTRRFSARDVLHRK